MTPMQQLLNQLRDERSKLSIPIEWDRCYQAIEMVIENTYLPLEKQQQEISDEEIEKGAREWYDKEGPYKPSAIALKTWSYAIKWYREQLKQPKKD
jgi:hypothetical protein